MSSTAKYIDRFFEEKALESRIYEVEASDGMTHCIPTEVVIEAIKGAPRAEQVKIANVLRRIDFANGDVHDFLAHLARPLAESKAAS